MSVSVLNYENAASASSETDDETTMCSDGDGVDRDKDVDGPAVGVPSLKASPQMGHALLSLKGVEVQEGLRNSHQHWRLGDNITIDAHKKSCGELRTLMTVGVSIAQRCQTAGVDFGVVGSAQWVTKHESNKKVPGGKDPERRCSLALFEERGGDAGVGGRFRT